MNNLIKNRTYCEDTIKLKDSIESSFINLGARLLEIRDNRLYDQDWESFEDFLIEMKMSPGTASKLINIYQVFVLKYNISIEKIASAGGWSIAAECLPYIKDKEGACELIEKASFLTQTDLRRELKELKTGVPMAKCEHSWESLCFRTCKKCGLKERDYEKEQKT